MNFHSNCLHDCYSYGGLYTVAIYGHMVTLAVLAMSFPVIGLIAIVNELYRA